MNEFAKNKTKLAAACGLSREGLYAFMRKEGWPKKQSAGWDIEACRLFVERHTEKESIAAKLNAEIARLKQSEIFEKGRKLKLANDIKEGMFVPKKKGIEAIERVAQKMDAIMEQQLENEYPSVVVGLESAQARVYGRRVRDRLREEFAKLAGELKGL